MNWIDIIVLVLYFIGLIFLAYKIKKAKTFDDFSLGSREIPTSLIFASLSATIIGPGYSMGLANKAAENGYIWLVVFLAFTLQTILVGSLIAPKMRKFKNAYTLGDIMGRRYGKAVQLISGILSVLLCAGFVGAIAKASGDIVSEFTGTPFIWSVVLSTVVVIIYSTYGGLKTVILTDTIQFIILAIGFPLTLVLIDYQVGLEVIFKDTPDNFLNLKDHFPPLALFSLFLSFFLGETLIPPYANRALVSKSSKATKKGFIAAGIFSGFWFFICATIGIIGITVFPNSENAFLAVIQDFLPIGVLGLVIASLVSIIMSSQDSLLNAASVSLQRDVIRILQRKQLNPLKTTKFLNIVIGVLAIVFALKATSIIDALLMCYTLWAPTIVLPLVIAVLYPKAKPTAGLVSIILGGLATIIWEWLLSVPYQIPSMLIGIIINQFSFWIVQFTFNKPVSHRLLTPVSK
jgi:SSS family solute:Na+ symporter